MKNEVVRVYTREDIRERERLDALIKQQLGMNDDEAEVHAYAARVQLTDEDRHVAKQLGLSDEQVRESKARLMLREAKGL